MKIAIIGAGGVGGFFGARLQQAGADVGFVARGAHLEALRRDGLKVESPLGDIHLPRVNVTDNAADLGRADIVWLAVKLWDTEAAIRSMTSVVGPDTGIISFQNGVQKDDVLRQAFGDKAVMGGVGYIAANIERPGRDQAHRHDAAPDLRRIRRPPLRARRGAARCLHARRHQRGAERRHSQGDLGEVRVSRRPLGIHDDDARDDRADPVQPADARFCST